MALDELLSDTKLREKMYTCAKEYCLNRYSYQKGEEVLHKMFSNLTPLSEHEAIYRLNNIVYDLLYPCPLEVTEEKVSRSLTETLLGFTGGIEKNKRYFICCQSAVFSELGICFASLGEPVGSVRIGIWFEDEQLRECVLDLEDFIRDNWTYVSFEPIHNSQNQVYTITLDFQYAENSALVGVFEDATKNTFITKLANKLGRPLKILDLLYVDCR